MDLNWKGLKRLKPSSKRFLFAYKPLAKKWSFGTYTSSTWIVLVSPLRTYYSQLRKSHRRILRDDFWWIDDLLMTSSSVRLLDGEMSESGWGWWPRESFRQERITCQDATQAFNTREMITVDMVCFTKPDTFKAKLQLSKYFQCHSHICHRFAIMNGLPDADGGAVSHVRPGAPADKEAITIHFVAGYQTKTIKRTKRQKVVKIKCHFQFSKNRFCDFFRKGHKTYYYLALYRQE